MPWNPNGGGGQRGGNPGGGGPGGGNNPWGRPSGGPGPNGPDIEDLIRKFLDQFRKTPIGGTPSLKYPGFKYIVAIAVGLWAATGIYQVQSDEQGVVMRFGRWTDTTDPGLHYHLPFPIETVLLPKVTRVNQLQLGFRSLDHFDRATHADVPTESRMLTGDENLVEANFVVFWKIKDAGKFLFNVRDPEDMVKIAAESVMRDVVAKNPIQAILSDHREPIAQQATMELQKLLDAYDSGIAIQEVQLQRVDPPAAVIDAFNDVQRAQTDRDRLKNEAEAYSNDVIPRANGDAQRMLQDAEAYKEQVVDIAQGEAKRFTSVLGAYRTAPDVISRRLYLDTMEEILKAATKVIIDPGLQRGGQGVLPYLPLPEPLRKSSPAPSDAASQSNMPRGAH